MNKSLRYAVAVTLLLSLSSCASINPREPRKELCAVLGMVVGGSAGAWADGAEAAAGVAVAGAVAGYFACKGYTPDRTIPTDLKKK